ncbi:hypothetical protein ACFL12_05245 [Pseudomonadota bacterium]
MGFATILALLAFCIAMVALWLTSDIIKKVENQNEKFVRAHIKSLRDEIRDVEKGLAKLVKRVASADESIATTDKRLNDHTKDIDGLRSRLAALSEEMETLDHSIPQRYRTRVVKSTVAKGKGDANSTPKTKPTVQ